MADPIHIQAPDGSVIEFPAGTDDSVITSVMAKNYGAPSQTPNPTPPDAAAPKSTLQSVREAIHAPTRALENGFFMGLGDRIRAGMGAAIGDGSYGSNLADEQNQTDQFQAAHPVIAPVLEGVGSAAAPLGAIGAASRATSLGGKFLLGAGAGGAIGGVQGALSSKDYTNLPQTAKDAAIGGIVGGGIGGSIPLAGRAIGSGYQTIANMLMGKPEGISRSAASHILPAVSADGLPSVQARVADLGPDAMLADAGPALLGKAQGASLNSNEGRSILQSALTARNEGTNQRIMGDVNRALGPAEDPQTVTNAITAHRSTVDDVAYPAALDNAPAVQTDAILKRLNGMIPRSVGSEQKALTNLRDMLTKKAEAPPPSAAPQVATQAAPQGLAGLGASSDHAKTVEALRAKFGDDVAAAYERQNKPAETPLSLLQFIASKGGLRPDSELEAIGLATGHRAQIPGRQGFFGVVGKNGAELDRMREAAEEAGYLRGSGNATSTPRDFLDAIDAELRGQKRYPEGFEGHVTKRENVARSEREQHEYDQHIRGLEDDLAAAGHGELGPDVKQRAVDLMDREGMPPDTAVEHALVQLEQEDAAGIGRGLASQPAPQAPATPQAPAGPARVPQTDANVLHKVKQELDSVIQYDAPGLGVPAGALTRQQGALKNMRGQINSALEDQVPGYLEANRQSAALARRGQSVDLGTQYLGAGKTTASPARFADEFQRLEPGEQIAFAKGSRGEIERQLGTKANDLQALRTALQGEGGWNTAKLATVHGPDAADQLIGTVNRNLKFRDTYNKVVENSQTAQRTAAANAMKPTPATETPLINPNMSLTGAVATGAKKSVNAIANAVLRRDPTKSYGEVARILSASGGQRDQHINAIIDALTRRQSIASAAPKVGDRAALIAAILGNAYGQNSRSRTQ